jgi:hypothetical protein
VVINQVNKSWVRNKENMDAYCLEVHKLENKFYGLEFHHVVRDNNVAADILSKLGSTHAQVPAGVFIHELHAPSIPEPTPTTTNPALPPAGQEVMMIDVGWRQPFIDYIREQKVPTDKNLAEQIISRAKSYILVSDKLYRRGATSGVLMKCVLREEGKDILEEIHKGVCGNHASSRTLVSKAFRRAFYWPADLGDAEELFRRCQGCQYFAKKQHVPAYKLVTIPPTWPFASWGLDMIGPLPTAPGGFNRVLVAIDKFTKWISTPLEYLHVEEGEWVGDKLRNIILQQSKATTPIESVLRGSGHPLLTSFGGRAAEYSGTGQGVYSGISLKILPSLSTMSSSSTSFPGILNVSTSPVYWYPRVSRAISGCTLLFRKLEATCSAVSPASLKALIFCSFSGS